MVFASWKNLIFQGKMVSRFFSNNKAYFEMNFSGNYAQCERSLILKMGGYKCDQVNAFLASGDKI